MPYHSYLLTISFASPNPQNKSLNDAVQRLHHFLMVILPQGRSAVAKRLSIGEPTFNLIIDGLTQPQGFRDIREESQKPLYRSGVMSLRDLRGGMRLSGRITNVVDFGVFVDIGVGKVRVPSLLLFSQCSAYHLARQQYAV